MRAIHYRNLCTIFFLVVSVLATQALGQSGQVKPVKPDEVAPPVVSEEKNKAVIATGSNDAQVRGSRSSESEAQELLYLKNYIEDYRLGPEDVISVEVFGPQTQIYGQQNITIPPDGKVNYKLIGQINVRGRTVQDVEKEITEKLNEYIIDPKVTVQIVQSHSMKYMIDGDVGKQGIYEMTRRMTVREAIINAGGILPTGDKTNVMIARATAGGGNTTLRVNYKELEKGKGLDEPIAPGDMIFVPGNRFKTIQKWMSVVQSVTWLPMIMVRR